MWTQPSMINLHFVQSCYGQEYAMWDVPQRCKSLQFQKPDMPTKTLKKLSFNTFVYKTADEKNLNSGRT